MKKTAVGILNSMNVDLESSGVEACHRIGKRKDGKLEKTIVFIVNCKFWKKTLLNRKNYHQLL